VIDYFSKIEESKICPLKIIIRKIVEIGHINEKVGFPQEIAQFIENNPVLSDRKMKNSHPPAHFRNPDVLQNGN
jgi:hypothetical protein